MSGRRGTNAIKVHFLDVGPEEYGDALLCQFGDVSVLVDGGHPGNRLEQDGHPSIPDQIGRLLGQRRPPYQVSLLIVTHGHLDHIGCLPSLIEQQQVHAEWALVCDPDMAWGRTGADASWDAGLDDRTRTLLAGLREEQRNPNTDDRTLGQFLADAVTLEDRYRRMLTQLDDAGTRVVRHGADSGAQLARTFTNIGLQVLGPSKQHLQATAALIGGGADALVRAARDALGRDTRASAADLYRRVQQADSGTDAADASRLGAAVNLQSIVTTFDFGGRTVFLGGDMQFADPQVSDRTVATSVKGLRKKMADGAPYSVAKLSHHGSDNAFDAAFYDELKGTKYIGICAGAGSTRHPNKATLDILNAHARAITWVRTDHNGQSTIDLTGTKPRVTVADGETNDPVPNSADLPARPASAERAASANTRVIPTAGGGVVEVTTRIPVESVRVAVAVTVEPSGRVTPAVSARTGDELGTRTLTLAGGRTLPPLLFVTSAEALARNIGREEASAVLDALAAARRDGHLLLSDVPVGVDSDTSVAAVQAELAKAPNIKGVVIVGGHDVMPARRLDSIPATLRPRISQAGDADHFIVWSDDAYGDRDGDHLPEVPVSRIPDGKSAELVFAALQAKGDSRKTRVAGVRNVARPFADEIFRGISTDAAMVISQPGVFTQLAADALDADHVYLMLHGDYSDSKRFWGEETQDDLEAINVSNVPASAGAVVFTGCCWGALTIDPPAGRYVPGQAVEPKTPEGSIALTFLRRGAIAFVGCTGTHYSPTEEPYAYYGGPMHAAFWAAIARGLAPAEALFVAKDEYVRGMPYGQNAPQSQAIGYKIWRQYTCLGLGW